MKILVCNRAEFTLTLLNDDRRVAEYPCAVGQPGYPTPEGGFEIESRAKDPEWWLPNEDWVAEELQGTVVPQFVTDDDGELVLRDGQPIPNPANPIKSRWLGFRDGAGIHGTDVVESIGTAASHGCVRLLIPDAEDLFPRVALGTPVAVI